MRWPDAASGGSAAPGRPAEIANRPRGWPLAPIISYLSNGTTAGAEPFEMMKT